MAFTDTEIAKHNEVIEHLLWARRRPPLHLRDKIREGQRWKRHAIEFFYVRPAFERPGQLYEEAISKLQYVRTRKIWRLYWKRADGKWHGYEPCLEIKSLAAALGVINEDAYNCFFG